MQETERVFKEATLEVKAAQRAAALQIEKTALQMEEARREEERQKQERDRRMEELDRQVKEARQEAARQKKETDYLVGKMTNRFGEMIEHLIAPNIVEKFNDLGYQFQGVSRDMEIKLDRGRALAEFDFLMENGNFCVGIEVKAKLEEKHVYGLEKKLAVLRQYKDLHGDRRKIRGAVATPIMGEAVRRLALKKGLYVIEQSGDTVQITEPPKETLQEW